MPIHCLDPQPEIEITKAFEFVDAVWPSRTTRHAQRAFCFHFDSAALRFIAEQAWTMQKVKFLVVKGILVI